MHFRSARKLFPFALLAAASACTATSRAPDEAVAPSAAAPASGAPAAGAAGPPAVAGRTGTAPAGGTPLAASAARAPTPPPPPPSLAPKRVPPKDLESPIPIPSNLQQAAADRLAEVDPVAAAELRAVDPAGDPYGPSEDVGAMADMPSKADTDLLDDAKANGPESAFDLVDPAPEAEWQKTLSRDLDALEGKGDAFLEVSFGLYDKLLAAGDGAPPLDRPLVDKGMSESATRYAELLAAVGQLKADLARPDVRKFLPLRGSEDKDEFQQVTALFGAERPPADKQKVVYDPAGRAGVTALLFGDQQHATVDAADGLTKAQQDALLLLDHLRQLSADLAFVSSTVTGWIHDTGDPELASSPYGVGGEQQVPKGKRARH